MGVELTCLLSLLAYSPSRAASEPFSAGSAYDAIHNLSDQEDFGPEDELNNLKREEDEEEDSRSKSLSVEKDSGLQEEENDMPPDDDIPSFLEDQDQDERSMSRIKEDDSQNENDDQSKSRSKSLSRSPTPVQESSISQSRSRSEMDLDVTVQPEEASLPEIENMDEEVEAGDSSIDRAMKKRDEALRAKEAKEGGSEDGFETQSDDDDESGSDEDEDGVEKSKGKAKGKEKRGAAVLKKRISRKKKR